MFLTAGARWLGAGLGVAVMFVTGVPASGQAIDCAGVLGRAEKVICDDPQLRAFDTQMAGLYARALKSMAPEDAEKLETEQQLWIDRRNACANYTEARTCIANLYAERNNRLQGLLLNLSRIALRVGQPPTIKTGVVTRDEPASYILAAGIDQTLVLDLEGTAMAFFYLVPATSDRPIYSSADTPDGNRASIVIPADGDYRIVVYLSNLESADSGDFTLSLELR